MPLLLLKKRNFPYFRQENRYFIPVSYTHLAKSEKFSLDTREEPTAELPSGWDGIGSGSTLSYDMPTKNKLVLTYDNVSYLFEKQNDSSKQTSKNSSASPLLNLAENDVWYSNDGSNEDTTTYELSLYDNYMELYSCLLYTSRCV